MHGILITTGILHLLKTPIDKMALTETVPQNKPSIASTPSRVCLTSPRPLPHSHISFLRSFAVDMLTSGSSQPHAHSGSQAGQGGNEGKEWGRGGATESLNFTVADFLSLSNLHYTATRIYTLPTTTR